MRLCKNEIESIVSLANQFFGSDVQVFLFGSRIDDQKRGGDIDLFIRNSDGKIPSAHEKVQFASALIMAIGEQKIDIVTDHPARRNSEFYKTIIQTGIQLC